MQFRSSDEITQCGNKKNLNATRNVQKEREK